MFATIISFAAVLPIQQFAADVFRSRISHLGPTNELARFVGYPSGAGRDQFRLNERFWLSGCDFSCVSPWNSALGRLGAGVAVTRRHILYSNHFMMRKGTRMVFIGQDGGLCPCYLEGSRQVADTGLMVGLLNAELTPNIVPAKVLPPDYAKHIGEGSGFPVVTFNQSEEAVLGESSCETMLNPRRWGANPSTNAFWRTYQKKLVRGDSGNPAFMLFGNQPVLIYCIYGGGGGVGNPIHAYRRETQRAMDELCPGYKLEEFDFTRFTPRCLSIPKKDVGIIL